MGHFCRIVCCLCGLLLITGCLADDPASFRTVNTLLSGHWVQDAPGPAPPTIDLRVDLSFETFSSAVPGIPVSGFHGTFWQAGEVLGLRGTGATEGVHVQFVLFSIQTSPELRMTLTEISDSYVAQTIGVEDISTLSADGVQSALRRLEGLAVPDDALSVSWDFLQ